MKIAYITAGAADMYCGSCMHDNTLAAALIAQGHECLLIPTYTPIRTDETDVSLHRVFFGGISIYLKQKAAIFRHLPGFVDRLLSQPALLRWVSGFAVKTQPEDLGSLTVSMLRGTAGNQRGDLRKLIRWLSDEIGPDIVCLTNALLSGIAPEIKARLGVPLLCTLQGEDLFLEWLPPSYKDEAIRLVRDNCRGIDGFLSPSRYYADFMSEYLALPRERIHVVHPGINVGVGGWGSGVSKKGLLQPPTSDPQPLTIGYLARISPEKGLHLLAEAFDILRRDPAVPRCELQVAGYLGGRDRQYLDDVRRFAERQGWGDRFHHVGEVDHAGKIAFLKSLDVLSVPTTYREPKGLYVLEAWAAGVPVVQARHGSFPELVEESGGGLLVEPHSPVHLAQGLKRLLTDPGERIGLGSKGHAAVHRYFHAGRMAEETIDVFRRYFARQPIGHQASEIDGEEPRTRDQQVLVSDS